MRRQHSFENTDILIKTSISHQSSTFETNLKSLSTWISSATIHISQTHQDSLSEFFLLLLLKKNANNSWTLSTRRLFSPTPRGKCSLIHLYVYIFHTYSCISIISVVLSVSFLLEHCLSKVVFSGTWKKMAVEKKNKHCLNFRWFYNSLSRSEFETTSHSFRCQRLPNSDVTLN